MHPLVLILFYTLFLSTPAKTQGLSSSRPQSIKRWQRLQRAKGAVVLDVINATVPGITQASFTQPLDHFDPTNRHTFEQQYWVNTQFYRSGGPVFVIDSGEGPGTERLSFILTGVGAQVAKATGGLALVLEHRYYGDSIPVANFSTDSLRWLTNEQALADSANFMQNVNITETTGINGDFTAPNRHWIYYGGSYAGARAALMKVVYPDIVFGAIASSGVTQAIVSLWQYVDVIKRATPNCSGAVVKATNVINQALERPDLNSELKAMFGLDGISDGDFASAIVFDVLGWQGSNWDNTVNEDTWTPFCESIATKPSNVSEQSGGMLGNLTFGYELRNYVNYFRTNVLPQCGNSTIDECFGTEDSSQFQVDDLSQTWRPWTFQVCTNWGFFQVAPPEGIPSIYPKVLNLDYESKICKQAFPPGKFIQVPDVPDVAAVNKYGGFHIAADRLAIIDGELDPWRPATAHSQYFPLPHRDDTDLRPFKLIPNAVHHWDENGLEDTSAEPPSIQTIHQEEIDFVKGWLGVNIDNQGNKDSDCVDAMTPCKQPSLVVQYSDTLV